MMIFKLAHQSTFFSSINVANNGFSCHVFSVFIEQHKNRAVKFSDGNRAQEQHVPRELLFNLKLRRIHVRKIFLNADFLLANLFCNKVQSRCKNYSIRG
jgi:hypothetical protein